HCGHQLGDRGVGRAHDVDGTVPRVARLRIGVQLSQQDTTIDELRAAWRAADDLGVDTIWVWDHFFPLYGDPNANHFEAYSVLDEWCADVGRDPADIERTVAISTDEIGALDSYRDAGAEHVIVMMAPPYDLDPVRPILEA